MKKVILPGDANFFIFQNQFLLSLNRFLKNKIMMENQFQKIDIMYLKNEIWLID